MAPGEEPSSFIQNLLPNAFCSNPTLEMTVFTELTGYGRTVRSSTPEAPIYYAAEDKGEQQRGYLIGGDRPLPREKLNDILNQTLAKQGLLPADKNHPAGLALVYYWGSHNAPDRDMTRQFSELAVQHMLERASLVGGRTYAHRLAMEFNENWADLDISPKGRFLKAQVADDLYYVVVSAYSYADLATGKHRLVWRTTMTVNTRGVSMSESLPPLIATAGNYFGRETTEPLALRRAVRRGTVTLGPLNIIEGDVLAFQPENRRRRHSD